MVVGDYFSKWKEANALFDFTAKTAADILAIEFVSRFCVSIRIHIDQGRDCEPIFTSLHTIKVS